MEGRASELEIVVVDDGLRIRLGVVVDCVVADSCHLKVEIQGQSMAQRSDMRKILLTIPPVLYGIVAASTKSPSNLCPSLAHLGYHLLNKDAFIRGDWLVIEVGL